MQAKQLGLLIGAVIVAGLAAYAIGTVGLGGGGGGNGGSNLPEYQVYLEAYQFGFNQTTIQVPDDHRIVVHLTTRDVAHGFGISELSVDVVARPGQEGIAEFDVTDSATYTFRCTEPYCGVGHPQMTGTFIIS